MRLQGKPSARQEEFLLAQTRYVAYGGARGGGKSWALRRKCILMALHYAGLRILLLRRTLAELQENHVLPLTAETAGLANYRAGEHVFVFGTGSRLKLGYCDTDADLARYQGQEYDVICMDEATQFTELQFRCLCACLRGGKRGFPKRFYLTCNPGGPGHGWVKRLFIDRRYRDGEDPADYTFIPARVFDNVYLMENDPGYLERLQSLPPDLRSAWLYGEWERFAGQFFTEFSRALHCVKPFPIPAGWERFYANDYGLDMLAGLWVAISPSGNAYIYREIYESGLIASEAARHIRALEAPEEAISTRFAPPDLWGRQKDTGKSIIDIFRENGLYFIRADSSRAAGWMALREWLHPEERDGQTVTRLHIFETCENLLRTLPGLQHDPQNPGDAALTPHELTHAPDALRYWAASVPTSRTEPDVRETSGQSTMEQYLFGLWNG